MRARRLWGLLAVGITLGCGASNTSRDSLRSSSADDGGQGAASNDGGTATPPTTPAPTPTGDGGTSPAPTTDGGVSTDLPGGTLNWVRLDPSATSSIVTTSPDGAQLVVNRYTSSTSALTGVNPADGQTAWTQSPADIVWHIGFDRAGSSLLALGLPQVNGTADALRFDDDGTDSRVVNGVPDQGCYHTGAAGDATTQALISICASDNVLSFGPANAWSFARPTGTFRMQQVAVDGAGDVLVTGLVYQPMSVGNDTFGASDGSWGTLVLKFSGTGTYLWGRQLLGAGHATPFALTVSNAGTVVVQGWFEGEGTLGNHSYNSNAGQLYVFALEAATGAPRFFDQFALAEQSTFALDPSGRFYLSAATVSRDCDHGVEVHEVDLSGAPIATQRFGCAGTDAEHVQVTTSATVGHDLILGGTYSGAVDFGQGTTTPHASSGTFTLRMTAP